MEPVADHRRSSPLRVLLIEDEDDDARLLVQALSCGGFEPVWERVATADAVAAAVSQREWDLIICDWVLAGLTALDVLALVHQCAVARRVDEIPIIIVSGAVGEEAAVTAMKAGAHDFVSKDKLARLAPAVERELREAAERRAHMCAEEALHVMQFSIDHSPDAAIWIGPDARLVYVNQAACRMFGYTRDELLAMQIHDIDGNSAADAWAQQWEMTKQVRSVTFPSVCYTKEGRLIPVEVSSNYIAFRGRAYICSLVRDIAERRRAEDALARSRQRLQTYIEEATDLIFTLDTAGAFTAVNRAVCETLGYTADEIVGKNPLGFVAPESQEIVAATLRRALEEKIVDPVESTVLAKDGRRVTLQVRGHLIFEGDRPAEIFVIGRDVTHERQVEAHARQTQKLEAVGRLAGSVAHDFNNQLTIIKGYAQFLLTGIGPDDPNRHDVECICDTVDRGARLVRQLLTFSRLDPVSTQPINLGELLESMAPMLRLLLGEQIALRLHTPSQLWPMCADRSQIEQVVMNLVSNAHDAMSPHGEVLTGDTVTIETRNLHPNEWLPGLAADLRPGPYVVLSVSDNGPGMSRKVQDHMFEPFFTTKEFGRGTGLGLATVYAIVKQHQGYVSCLSEIGRGTTFRIYFPRDESGAGAALPQPTPAAQPGQTCRRERTVLVAEDEANVREVLVRALEESGYRAYGAARAEEALTLAAHVDEPVDLLVTDIVMPGINGHHLAQHVRQLHPNLRVLFVSGYSVETLDLAALPGARFLQKPFGLDELLGRIDEMLAEG